MNYFNKEDLIIPKTKIEKSDVTFGRYDMYYIRFYFKDGTTRIVRTFCEKNTFPNLQDEKLKKIEEKYGMDLKYEFFIKQLLGPKGIMSQDGRNDYLYLGGELLKNNQISNRNMIQQNDKTGLENFNEFLSTLKIQVEAVEHTSVIRHNNRGRYYAIADIHGMYGSYMEVMKKMRLNDHLYILGDVIDRGTGGIDILQDIIKRKKDEINNPKITFLLGNHEMQFIESVAIMLRHKLTKKDIENIMLRKLAISKMGYYSLDEDDDESQEKYEKWEGIFNVYDSKCQELAERKNLNSWEMNVLGTWIFSNKGYTTLFDYLKGGKVKTGQEQQEIYKFLCDSYVVLPQHVNNTDYLFVHSMPPMEIEMLEDMKETGKGYKIPEISREQYFFMLQERNINTYKQAKDAGFTTICGHTPEFEKIRVDEEQGFVRIDTGCGHKQKGSKLALYCLDDNSVEYIDEKEKEDENVKEGEEH